MTSFAKGCALIIGLTNYHHVSRLPDIVLNDASDISTLLTNPTQCGYSPSQVQLLLDDQATAKSILEGLAWLVDYSTEDSTVLVFFSRHRGQIKNGPQAENYLIPVDTNPVDLKKIAIESAELTGLLGNIRANRLLVLFDCCHAGSVGEIKDTPGHITPGFKSGLDERYYDPLVARQGCVIVASSRFTEVLWVLPGQPNGLPNYVEEAFISD